MTVLELDLMLGTSVLAETIAPLDLTIRFTNRSDKSIRLYPSGAQLRPAAGWVGPDWSIRLTRGADALGPVQLRTWYGPPGMPPTKSYFERAGFTLQPGKSRDASISCCWLPRAILPSGSLAMARLDPEGMDRLDPATEAALGVLVLGETCAAMEARKQQSLDFLRPATLIFVQEAGHYQLELTYSQGEWFDFYEPADEVQVTARTDLAIVTALS